MSAGEISIALHGTRNGKGFLCHCPVPSHGRGHGDKYPSLSIGDAPNGKLLLKCFAGCDALDVLAELRRRSLIEVPSADTLPRRFEPRPAPSKAAREPPDDEAKRKTNMAAWLWGRREPVSESNPAELYLRKRGYCGAFPATLGYLPPSDKHPPAKSPYRPRCSDGVYVINCMTRKAAG